MYFLTEISPPSLACRKLLTALAFDGAKVHGGTPLAELDVSTFQFGAGTTEDLRSALLTFLSAQRASVADLFESIAPDRFDRELGLGRGANLDWQVTSRHSATTHASPPLCFSWAFEYQSL